MDHYLHNKQKLKAIARYTFKHIAPSCSHNNNNKQQVSVVQMMQVLKATMLKYDAQFNDCDIEDLVQGVDRSHKGMLGFDDFVDLFEKAFEKVWDARLAKGKSYGKQAVYD